MTTAELLGRPPSPGERHDDRARALRMAGIGALIAALAWLPIPVRVFLVPTEGDLDANPELFYRTAAQIADERWQGALTLLSYGGIGVGMLLFVGALARIVASSSTSSDTGVRLGALGGFGYLLAGGLAAGFSAFGDNVGDITDDVAIQRVVHAVVEVVTTGMLIVGTVGFAVWLLWLGTSGRRAGVAGVPALIGGILFAIILVIPLAVWGQPMGAITVQPVWCLVLGVALLVKARRADRS